jgi:hypothetical protein
VLPLTSAGTPHQRISTLEYRASLPCRRDWPGCRAGGNIMAAINSGKTERRGRAPAHEMDVSQSIIASQERRHYGPETGDVNAQSGTSNGSWAKPDSVLRVCLLSCQARGRQAGISQTAERSSFRLCGPNVGTERVDPAEAFPSFHGRRHRPYPRSICAHKAPYASSYAVTGRAARHACNRISQRTLARIDKWSGAHDCFAVKDTKSSRETA